MILFNDLFLKVCCLKNQRLELTQWSPWLPRLCNLTARELANKRADLRTLKLKHADELKGIQEKEAEKGETNNIQLSDSMNEAQQSSEK